MRTLLGAAAILLLAGCADTPPQPVTATAPAATAPAAQAGLIGSWRGSVVGLSSQNPERSLRITAMQADGPGSGVWGGEPVTLRLSGGTLTFTSATSARVSLRQSAPDRLEGTYSTSASRNARPLVLTRQ